jgi:CSLREA domain-containing protein
MTAYQKKIASVLLVMLLATTFLATPGRVHGAAIVAKPFDENNVNTDAICSLREAIIAANTNTAYGGCPAGTDANDEIYLQPGQHVLRLTGTDTNDSGYKGDLDITSGVTIIGSGSSTEIRAEFQDRIFHIKTSNKVTISNLTMKNGNASSYISGIGGGAILNDSNSDLFLSFVTITGNIAGTNGEGGGITNKSTAKLSINASTINGNVAFFGGGIYNEGLLTITNSLISSNSASTGGGLDNNSQLPSEKASLNNTTVTKNIGTAGGGGISNSGTLVLLYDSIVDNDNEGVSMEPGSKVTFQNSIISGHTSYNCVYHGENVTITDLNYNLEDNSANTCRLTLNTQGFHNIIGQSPMFVQTSLKNLLAYNGGPTQTYALQLTSPAIDAIPVGNASCGGVDQRLYGRGGDGGDADSTPGCDIGAYEKGGTQYQIYTPVINR